MRFLHCFYASVWLSVLLYPKSNAHTALIMLEYCAFASELFIVLSRHSFLFQSVSSTRQKSSRYCTISPSGYNTSGAAPASLCHKHRRLKRDTCGTRLLVRSLAALVGVLQGAARRLSDPAVMQSFWALSWRGEGAAFGCDISCFWRQHSTKEIMINSSFFFSSRDIHVIFMCCIFYCLLMNGLNVWK